MPPEAADYCSRVRGWFEVITYSSLPNQLRYGFHVLKSNSQSRVSNKTGRLETVPRLPCFVLVQGNCLVPLSMAKIRDKNRSKNPKTHSSVRDRPIVSIQAVKSLWGDRVVFPRLGIGNTDRWRINLCLCDTCQCPRCQMSEK